MIQPFDADGDLPEGVHRATWVEFREHFCRVASSERRLSLCRLSDQMMEDARASQIVERIIFGGSVVTSKPEPNDFDCVVVLVAGTGYETLKPHQRWVADTREASRRCKGDVFVARADQPTLAVYQDFLSLNRQGKRVGLVGAVP